MIDLFDIIKANNLIGNLTPEELAILLENDSTDTYTIMLVSKNRIIIKNNHTNNLEKLDCVCNYFELTTSNCAEIKDRLGCSDGSCNCKDCFKTCLTQLQTGTLNKK